MRIPLLRQDGWLRHQENIAEGLRFKAQTGWSLQGERFGMHL